MQKIELKDGLLYVSVKIEYEGKDVVIDNVIIDTGAAHTILLTDYLNELDAGFSDNDQLVKSSGYGGVVFSAVRKKINKIEIYGIELKDIKVDFGVIDPYERVNGLIGMDFLLAARMIIDLNTLEIYQKSKE